MLQIVSFAKSQQYYRLSHCAFNLNYPLNGKSNLQGKITLNLERNLKCVHLSPTICKQKQYPGRIYYQQSRMARVLQILLKTYAALNLTWV